MLRATMTNNSIWCEALSVTSRNKPDKLTVLVIEAEYTFRLRKKIIPLRLQLKYYPDGWLGILVGSKLVFDCSVQNKIEDSIRHLIRELGNTGKGLFYYVHEYCLQSYIFLHLITLQITTKILRPIFWMHQDKKKHYLYRLPITQAHIRLFCFICLSSDL